MKIILASKSGVRKKILENFNISCDVIVSNVDEDEVKNSLLAEGANPLLISKYQRIKNLVMCLQILQWYLLRKLDYLQGIWL